MDACLYVLVYIMMHRMVWRERIDETQMDPSFLIEASVLKWGGMTRNSGLPNGDRGKRLKAGRDGKTQWIPRF